jgi:hypothetical protein
MAGDMQRREVNAQVIEAYLREEFSEGGLRAVRQPPRTWTSFAVDLSGGSLHCSFSRDFLDHDPTWIHEKLCAYGLAGAMRQAGPDTIILVRSDGISQHSRMAILPPA